MGGQPDKSSPNWVRGRNSSESEECLLVTTVETSLSHTLTHFGERRQSGDHFHTDDIFQLNMNHESCSHRRERQRLRLKPVPVPPCWGGGGCFSLTLTVQ